MNRAADSPCSAARLNPFAAYWETKLKKLLLPEPYPPRGRLFRLGTQ
jgi:hypothetical protein